WFEEAERTNDLDALQDHLNTKSVEKDGLTGESLQKLLQLYRHLNPSQREALRFAYIFRQSSSVLNLGKDAYKSAEIIEPALQVLVEKEVITADQKNLILALISQHEDFNTTQYGESVPPRIGDYLTEKGLEVSDYYGPASFMYVVDHSGTQAGILTNSMLENADWLSHEEHIASLFAHWEKVRWLEGFRGKGATPIPLAQLTQLEAYELPAFIREELDSAGPREYALTFEQMLRKKMSFVGWAYHFLRRLGDLDEHSLLRFLYLNSKIFEFFEKKGRPLHILKFLIMEKNLAHIQENAEFSHAVFQDTTCADMAEFFHEAYADETALLEAVQERFHLRFVYSGDTLLLDWNNVYSGMEGSALSRFPVTQKILGKAS
ncbi:MAG: hypothetical protein JW774_00120, partial [Candidatus Aureabacteria bacterium]|nr:hypothetical protein [Candidatus Auribacterota bacterium]